MCSCGARTIENQRLVDIVNVCNENNSGTASLPCTRFSDLFHSTIERLCNQCQRHQRLQETFHYDQPANHCYLLLSIYNVSLANNNYKPLNITEFNPLRVNIPGINTLLNYKVKSIICRTGETCNAGHYLNWQPNQNNTKWLRISDESCKAYCSLIKNIQNAYLLFLEKIN